MDSQKTVGRGWSQKLMVLLLSAGYLTLGLTPAYASDTEVYTQEVEVSGVVNPTLMMLLDSSGSMTDCMVKDAGGVCQQTRFEVLLSAMRKVLFGSEDGTVKPIPGNIKLGFSRFNPNANNGGWIVYPARPLDAFTGFKSTGSVVARATAGSDDADQMGGSLNLTRTELQLGKGSVGLRFLDVAVPKGAKVVEAYLEFTASRAAAAGELTWQIGVHDVADSPTFQAGANAIDSRSYGAVVSTFKTDEAWVKEQVYSVSVRESVQQLVERADWCGGNAVSLRLTDVSGGANTRYVYSFEGANAKAARLVVNYSIDPAATDSCIYAPVTVMRELKLGSDDVDYAEAGGVVSVSNSALNFLNVTAASKRRQVGLRFPHDESTQRIQKGAVVEQAYIQGYWFADPGKSDPATIPTVQVTAFDVSNMPEFCPSSGACAQPALAVRADTLWNPGKKTDIAAGKQATIDVKAHVQALLNKNDWTPDNAIGFRMRSNSTATTANATVGFYAAESAPVSRRVRLTIKARQRYTNLSELKTVRDEIWEELQALKVDGGTPLGAAYAETMRYMLGLPVFAPLADARTMDEKGLNYVSPIGVNNQCAGNFIFQMTDGEPNNLAQVGVNTKGIIGETCPTRYSSFITGNSVQPETWRCMFAAAEWGVNPANQLGSTIRTNTVLFGDNDPNNIANLTQVATFGAGSFYKAGDEESFIKALQKTVDDLLDQSGSITAPGVAVNQLNRLNNLDQLYYAVFDPESTSRWPGNVKRYRLDIQKEAVLDRDGKNAIDPVTTFFHTDARSFWSDTVDGSNARLGGVASNIPLPDSRKLYTHLGALPAGASGLTLLDPKDGDLVAKVQARVATVYPSISTPEVINLLQWYRGYQVPDLGNPASDLSVDLLRKEIGGVLHSRPILVSYGFTGSAEAAATDPEKQDNTLYFSTMEGTLHAVDAKSGTELFGFIPGEKLPTLKKLHENKKQLVPEFGLDLTWSVLRKDVNGDGQIGLGDKVYIYGGMRMGGSNYYALDVTNRADPKLLFAIKGGSGDFKGMGQTWSQPVTGAIKVNGTVRTVLFFGGGYDPQHETANTLFPSDSVGNQLFIVDAESGEMIWSASASGSPTMTVSEMKHAVPMSPKPVDIDADGLMDHVYFADLGGQVFRADIDNSATASASLVKRVKRLASLAGTTVAGQRRFYEPPTVALFKDGQGSIFAGVGLGSGYRSHPLNEATTDHFFVLFDYDVPRPDILTATTFQKEIAISDLTAVSPGADTVDLTGKLGWYVEFPDVGEKVITSGVFFRNTLIFSSYVPSVEGGNKCSPVIGRSKVYSICVMGGGLCGNSEAAIKVKDNAVLGLGGDPQLIVLPDPNDPTKSNIGIITGTDVEQFGEGMAAGLRRTRWMEKTPQN